MKLKNIIKNKKFRYGSMSVLFTALLLTLIVVLNAVFSLLADHFHLYVDMTKEQYFSVSDSSKELLGKLKYDGKLSIVFLQHKDKITDSTLEYQGDDYLKQIHELALDYASEFPDLVELRYIDMYHEIDKTKKYVKQGMSLNPTSVIFDNDFESDTSLFRITGYKSFLMFDSAGSKTEPIGFYGEHRITSNILGLCSKQLLAYVTEGHNEDPLGEAFKLALESCGFTVKNVNLTEVTPEMLLEDNPRLVIINNPKKDFIGVDGGKQRNEIGKLTAITTGSYMNIKDNPVFGSVMLFAEPGNELPNLNSFTSTWGLSVNTSANDLVTEDVNNALDVSKQEIVTSYEENAASIGYNLVRKLLAFDNFRVAMKGAGTVSVNSTGFDNPIASSVLNVSKGASNRNEKLPAAGMSVLAVSQKENIVENSVRKYNYVFACADSSIISDAYMSSSSYANESLITNLLRAVTSDSDSSPDTAVILHKDYVKGNSVTGVTTFGKKAFLVFMAVIIPAALITAGTVVYYKRKNK